jgi:secreted Zn-dependent insulinase-like peptidase
MEEYKIEILQNNIKNLDLQKMYVNGKLKEKHLEKAKQIVKENHKKKNCNNCYNRGYTGINILKNEIVICKCVDKLSALTKWCEYIRNFCDIKTN